MPNFFEKEKKSPLGSAPLTINQSKASEVKTDIGESLPEQKYRMWHFQIWKHDN